MGSIWIAAWIAALAFPILLIWGFVSEELGPKALVVFVLLGAAVRFGLPAIPPSGGSLVTPALAVLDIVLVLMIFKRDIRITWHRSERPRRGSPIARRLAGIAAKT